MRVSINILHEKSQKLRNFLELYAKSDSDVDDAYEWIKPLLDRVDTDEVVWPQKFPYGWIFFRGENNLPAYPELLGAAAEFANALESE